MGMAFETGTGSKISCPRQSSVLCAVVTSHHLVHVVSRQEGEGRQRGDTTLSVNKFSTLTDVWRGK